MNEFISVLISSHQQIYFHSQRLNKSSVRNSGFFALDVEKYNSRRTAIKLNKK